MKNKYIILICVFVFFGKLKAEVNNSYLPDSNSPNELNGMKLVWNDEFDIAGSPNPLYWKYENGFVRNAELQWYQPDNVSCKNGLLVFEAKRENVLNPNYLQGSTDWKKSRQYANYTSSSIQTPGLVQIQFGRIEVRARIDVRKGAWPAIWTLGASGEWPSCGEVDIMEFYRKSNVPSILANVAWGTATRWTAHWDAANKPLSYFVNKDPDWASKFHIWRMDWNKDSINLYLDDELMNTTLLNQTINDPGFPPINPFLQKHYFLLNLAIGANGGDPSTTIFPITYEVDYIRVWKKFDPTEKNRIYNGDFSDTFIGWYCNKAIIVEESSIGNLNGSYCRLTDANSSLSIEQTIDVVSGKMYNFCFTGRIQNTHAAGIQPNNNPTLGVATLKAKLETSTGLTLLEVSTQSNTNTRVEGNFTVPTGVSSVKLSISKNWNMAYIDDVSVIEDINSALHDVQLSELSINYNQQSKILSFYSDKTIKQIIIYNLMGQILAKKTVESKNTATLDFTAFSKGIYLVQTIFSNNTLDVKKVKIYN